MGNVLPTLEITFTIALHWVCCTISVVDLYLYDACEEEHQYYYIYYLVDCFLISVYVTIHV
jgi:hypothetical protein